MLSCDPHKTNGRRDVTFFNGDKMDLRQLWEPVVDAALADPDDIETFLSGWLEAADDFFSKRDEAVAWQRDRRTISCLILLRRPRPDMGSGTAERDSQT
jgi:hypothetical protein